MGGVSIPYTMDPLILCRKYCTSIAKERTAVVLGGGISGLSAAFYLSSIHHPEPAFHKVILLESSPRVGGWVKSLPVSGGNIFEQGPRTVRVTPQAADIAELADLVGLEDQFISVKKDDPANINRYIFFNGKIVLLPKKMPNVLKPMQPLTESPVDIMRREFKFKKPKPEVEDKTVYDFVEGHFGAEVADRLADPFFRGIYASNIRLLSAKATLLAPLLEAERKSGSLIKHQMKNLIKKCIPFYRSRLSKAEKRARVIQEAKLDLIPMEMSAETTKKMRKEKWTLWSLKDGLESLPRAIVEDLKKKENIKIKLETACTGLKLSGNGAEVQCSDGSVIQADHVFSGIYAKHLAAVLDESHSELTNMLNSIQAVTVGVVNLEYKTDKPILKHQGFGHLVPSNQDSKLLGIIYDSCCFPSRNQEGTTVLTCMLGGSWFQQHLGDPDKLSKKELALIAIEETHKQLGIPKGIEPSHVYMDILKDCIPQYRLGHLELVENMEKYISDNTLPLSLLGSSYRGVGVGDCVRNAKQTVLDVVWENKYKAIWQEMTGKTT